MVRFLILFSVLMLVLFISIERLFMVCVVCFSSSGYGVFLCMFCVVV